MYLFYSMNFILSSLPQAGSSLHSIGKDERQHAVRAQIASVQSNLCTHCNCTYAELLGLSESQLVHL